MRVCAWCRRIDYHGRWMPLEEFLQQGFDTPTTHGSARSASTFKKRSLTKRSASARRRPKNKAPPPDRFPVPDLNLSLSRSGSTDAAPVRVHTSACIPPAGSLSHDYFQC